MSITSIAGLLVKRIPIIALILYTFLKWRYILAVFFGCFSGYIVIRNIVLLLIDRRPIPYRSTLILVFNDAIEYFRSFADFFCVDLSYVRFFGDLIGYFRTCPSTTVEIEDLNNGVKVYVYKPSVLKDKSCLLYIHGGGWYFLSAFAYNPAMSWMAHYLQMVVVSVEYKLAPEHPFPEPLLDCYSALQWVYNHAADLDIDEDKIFIAGDSAGGNLSTALCLLHQDRKGAPIGEDELTRPPLKGQVLIYPALQLYEIDGGSKFYNSNFFPDSNTVRTLFSWYILGDDTLGKIGLGKSEFDKVPRFWETAGNVLVDKPLPSFRRLERYTGDGISSLGNSYIFPLHDTDLKGFIPTLIITATADTLRDDGYFMEQYLKMFKVPVKLLEFEDVHGFFSDVTGSTNAIKAVEAMEKWIREN